MDKNENILFPTPPPFF